MNTRHPFKTVAFGVALTLMLASAIGMNAAIKAAKFSLRKEAIHPESGRVTSDIPLETESWIRIGTDRREEAEVEKTLGTENYLSRVYIEKHPAPGEKPIVLELHLAYYTGMIDTVPHVPDRCFVGGGLQLGSLPEDLLLPLDTKRFSNDPSAPELLKGQVKHVRLNNTYSSKPGSMVRLPREPESIRMRCTEFKSNEGGSNLYAGYFFIANGRTTPSANDVRLLAFNLKERYAYYLKVQITSSSVRSKQDLATQTARLLDELLGEIMTVVPDWVEVEKGNWPKPKDADAMPTTGAASSSTTPTRGAARSTEPRGPLDRDTHDRRIG
ncbi:MAG: hypothetical protein AB7Q00_05635 [Phycisphaerales bacterium]